MEVWAVLRQAFQVTAFVAVMMIAVEYLNVLTRGAWPETLAGSKWKQYLVAVVLGATPGCLGAFAVVALYTHRMVSFGALVACMIATSGDESFVMFALFPGKALILTLALALVGLVSGMLTDLLGRGYPVDSTASHGFTLHEEEACRGLPLGSIIQQLRNPSAARMILCAAIGLFGLALVAGAIGPASWNWLRWTLLLVGGFALFIVLTVPDHFLGEHLWRHVAVQHVPRIFAWTLGAMIVVAVVRRLDPAGSFVGENRWVVLGIASLLGIIPESGPHLLFVTLYSEGVVALGILAASSIVQDGHGMLPLLAFSRRQFIEVKVINLAVGLLLGAILLLSGL
jgi:hypothetical protein